MAVSCKPIGLEIGGLFVPCVLSETAQTELKPDLIELVLVTQRA